MNQAREQSTMELHDLDRHDVDRAVGHDLSTEEPETATSLPAADGGLVAWRLLIVAFVFEALLWGQPRSSLGIVPTNADIAQASRYVSAYSKPTIRRFPSSKNRLTSRSLER
jgi:hypothetical protein